jgi:hypothetical protein
VSPAPFPTTAISPVEGDRREPPPPSLALQVAQLALVAGEELGQLRVPRVLVRHRLPVDRHQPPVGDREWVQLEQEQAVLPQRPVHALEQGSQLVRLQAEVLGRAPHHVVAQALERVDPDREQTATRPLLDLDAASPARQQQDAGRAPDHHHGQVQLPQHAHPLRDQDVPDPLAAPLQAEHPARDPLNLIERVGEPD